jgi:hypothetical protein
MPGIDVTLWPTDKEGIPPAGLIDANFSAVPGSTDCIMIENRREIPPGFKVSGDHHCGLAAFAYSGGMAGLY